MNKSLDCSSAPRVTLCRYCLLEEKAGSLLERQTGAWAAPQKAAEVRLVPRHADGPRGSGILGNGVRWRWASEGLGGLVHCSKSWRGVPGVPMEGWEQKEKKFTHKKNNIQLGGVDGTGQKQTSTVSIMCSSMVVEASFSGKSSRSFGAGSLNGSGSRNLKGP